jgi:hypothetical protein
VLYSAKCGHASISIAIDAYNHSINGIDIANQRKKYLSILQNYNIRSWKSLFY